MNTGDIILIGICILTVLINLAIMQWIVSSGINNSKLYKEIVKIRELLEEKKRS